MTWSWGSFAYGVIFAWSLPWIVFAVVVATCRVVQSRRRRTTCPLTEPGVSVDALTAALAARQAKRDREAAEDLIRSLSRRA